MRIAVDLPSAAALRTLSSLFASAGYEIAPPSADAHAALSQQGQALLLRVPGRPDQTIPCPVAPHRLVALLSTALRGGASRSSALAHGWLLDEAARSLTHPASNQVVTLTEKECLLLGALRTALPDARSREALLKDVWSYDADAETHTLETHIYRLRGKLAALQPAPCDIVTTDGSYRLVLE